MLSKCLVHAMPDQVVVQILWATPWNRRILSFSREW